jgi:hypothetical protein
LKKKVHHRQFFQTGSVFGMKTTLWLALAVQAMKVALAEDKVRISVHPKTGKLLTLALGGVIPKRKFRVMAKYTTEACGCSGVCCRVIDGTEHGQFIETFDYTEKKLVSIKAYTILMQQEMTYCRNMKSQGWKDYDAANPRRRKLENTLEGCTSYAKVQVSCI